jgi:hypothetical protein
MPLQGISRMSANSECMTWYQAPVPTALSFRSRSSAPPCGTAAG